MGKKAGKTRVGVLRQVSDHLAGRALELIGARVFLWVVEHPHSECVISHDNGGVAVRFTVRGKPVDVDAFKERG